MVEAGTPPPLSTNHNNIGGDNMSKNNTTQNQNPNPIFIMTPQQPQQQDDSILDGLGGLALSALAGLVLGQFGIGFPKLPKL